MLTCGNTLNDRLLRRSRRCINCNRNCTALQPDGGGVADVAGAQRLPHSSVTPPLSPDPPMGEGFGVP